MQNTHEDLRTWFRQKWVNLAKKKTGGGYAPCGTSGEKKGYAKCVPAAKASALSKDAIKSAVRRKRAAQSAAGRPGKNQPGQGNAPIMVKTMKEENLQEKNTPTNPTLWARAKSLARSKFDVYPSAYANGWAAKWYRGKGGGWKSTNESKGPCWDGYKQVGTKMKNGKEVPNCVPVTEELGKDSEWGTPELTKKMMKMTPGQGKKMRSFKEFVEYETDESVLMEKGLTPMGRIQKRFSAIRSRQKRKLYKNIAMNRSASPERIQKRAKLAARRMMYKRVLRGRPNTSLSPTEKSGIEAMMKRVPFQAFIARQTIRLRPNLRKMEMSRLSNRRTRKKKK